MSARRTMVSRWLFVFLVAVFVGCLGGMASPADAGSGAIVSGFDSYSLAGNDDGSTSALSLPFSLNFYGTSYSSLYLNNNGNLTFFRCC